MFVCLSLIGLSFSIFSGYGKEGVITSTIVWIGTGGLALSLRRSQWNLAFRTFVLAALGAMAGDAVFKPIGAHGDLWAQAQPSCIGAVFGVVAGRILLWVDRHDLQRLSAEQQDTETHKI